MRTIVIPENWRIRHIFRPPAESHMTGQADQGLNKK
jgi:hypothetical protein